MKVERWNTPGTGETAENAEGGLLIVMPPEWGPVKHEGESQPKARGLIVSGQIDRGPVIPELLRWLELAGFDVRANAKAFSIFAWPSERFADCHGPQQIPRLLEVRGSLLDECRRRQPKILIFLSCYLFDATQEPEMINEMREIFGSEIEKPRRLCATRLRAQTMRFERAVVLAFPLPGQNTTDSFVNTMAAGLRPIAESLRRV